MARSHHRLALRHLAIPRVLLCTRRGTPARSLLVGGVFGRGGRERAVGGCAVPCTPAPAVEPSRVPAARASAVRARRRGARRGARWCAVGVTCGPHCANAALSARSPGVVCPPRRASQTDDRSVLCRSTLALDVGPRCGDEPLSLRADLRRARRAPAPSRPDRRPSRPCRRAPARRRRRHRHLLCRGLRVAQPFRHGVSAAIRRPAVGAPPNWKRNQAGAVERSAERPRAETEVGEPASGIRPTSFDAQTWLGISMATTCTGREERFASDSARLLTPHDPSVH